MNFGARDQLIIPYTLDANDMRFATAQGFNTGGISKATCATASTVSMQKARPVHRN
jgi:hypothetical protein